MITFPKKEEYRSCHTLLWTYSNVDSAELGVYNEKTKLPHLKTWKKEKWKI
jgi:hypothetical protein